MAHLEAFRQFKGLSGAFYVRVSEIAAIGPEVTHTLPEQVKTRKLYLRGGHVIEMLDTPQNMASTGMS